MMSIDDPLQAFGLVGDDDQSLLPGSVFHRQYPANRTFICRVATEPEAVLGRIGDHPAAFQAFHRGWQIPCQALVDSSDA